jgi:hypothetical protein
LYKKRVIIFAKLKVSVQQKENKERHFLSPIYVFPHKTINFSAHNGRIYHCAPFIANFLFFSKTQSINGAPRIMMRGKTTLLWFLKNLLMRNIAGKLPRSCITLNV